MIDDLMKCIRDFCNHPWKRGLLFQDRTKLNKLWASLDAIENSQLAIDYYIEMPDFAAFSGGYLNVYGLMQALFIQQDALSSLSLVLFDRFIDFPIDFPELSNIRNIRNDSIGHPTNRKSDKSFHYIGRDCLNKSQFSLVSFFPKDKKDIKIEYIKTLELISTQERLIQNILEKTMANLQLDFENHKNKFKDQKLYDLIEDGFHYEFTKLYEHVGKDYPPARGCFMIIKEAYDKIKIGIIERYFTFEALTGLPDTVKTLDYIFSRIENDLFIHKISDEIELHIFIDALISNFKEFENTILAIDKEFEL